MEESEVRLEERIKLMQPRLEQLESDFREASKILGVCERCDISSQQKKLQEFEKRLSNLEYLSTTQENRWTTITKYIFQAIWIILLAWALTKLNLNTPPFS
jgi:uncharacterized coiled-coil protein SlyX